MPLLKNYCKEFYEKVELHRSISRLNITKEQFEKVMLWIDYINSLDAEVDNYHGRAFENWKVPNALKGLFVPKKVAVAGTNEDHRMYEDLQTKPEVADPDLSYAEFQDVIIGLYGSKRKVPKFDCSLDECRKFSTITDSIIARSVDEHGMIKAEYDSTELPLEIPFLDLAVKKSFRSMDVEEYMVEMWINILKEISTL